MVSDNLPSIIPQPRKTSPDLEVLRLQVPGVPPRVLRHDRNRLRLPEDELPGHPGGLWFSVNSVKGKSALQLSRELGAQYKTAWVLLMKMREAVATRRFRMMLEGEVHIDGKYAGGHIKQKNRKGDRVDRRRAGYQNFKRLTILTLREKTPFGRRRDLFGWPVV